MIATLSTKIQNCARSQALAVAVKNQQVLKPNDIHSCHKHRAAKCPDARTTHITNQKYIFKIAMLKLAFQSLLTAKRGSLHKQTSAGYSKSKNAEQAVALSLLLLELVICEEADLLQSTAGAVVNLLG